MTQDINRRRLIVASAAAAALPAAASATRRVDSEHSLATFEGLSGFDQPDGGIYGDGVSRTAYSDADPAGRASATNLLRETVSVTNFGAKGDGATDDTAAIQAAVSYAGKIGADCHISGSKKSYDIYGTIVVPDNVRLYGRGHLRMRVAENNVLELGNNCTVDGVGIEGFNALGAGVFELNNGIYVDKKINVTIRNCSVYKCGYSGIQTRGCSNLLIESNRLWLNLFTGPGGGSASDIIVYSFSLSQSTIISGNYCMSNNSQGIFFNALGLDSDAIIIGNHCRAANTLLTSWPDLVAAKLIRRHGIVCNYTGTGMGRLIVANNNVRNTRWTGIYSASATAAGGTVMICNNMISFTGINSETGVGTGASGGLCGGIWLNSNGNELITGNYLSQTGNTIQGAITVVSSLATANPSIINNNISQSGSSGIMLTNSLAAALVQNNNIEGSAGSDVRIELTSGPTRIGDFDIRNNRFTRTNSNAPSIFVAMATAAKICRISNNIFRGQGANYSTANTHCAVQTNTPLVTKVVGNDIRGFKRGIDVATVMPAATRFANLGISQNEISDCGIGVGIGSSTNTSTALLDCNIFTNVATPADKGSVAAVAIGVVGWLRDGRIVAYATAAPTTGLSSIGDRRINNVPTVGQPKAWVATTAANPGVWVSEGIL